jgi:very-short-patch-repair endonuclease
VSVAQVLEELGGVATRAQLMAVSSRADVDRALLRGLIVATARGRYALPTTGEALALAHAVGGVLSHSSAALHHGWEVKLSPERAHVIVPRHRRVARHLSHRVVAHYADLDPSDVSDGIVTSPEATLIFSLRGLPDDEALAVADSALRHGVPPNTLRRVAQSVQGAGSAKVRRIADAARAEAANPFESCLRWIALGIPGLSVRPQVTLPGLGVRPDLVDEQLGIVLEADSFEWHGDRAALRRDARRYNLMVVNRWWVLRFAWEDVMFEQGYVREVLEGVVDLAQLRAQPCCAHRCAG